jgi:ATP-dependent helicase/nuclease subunit B
LPTEFLLASVGAGKTEAAQSRLTDLKRSDPFAKVWCLLATERQIYAFRQRLMERPDAADTYVNVEFFTFYTLYHYILESAGNPQRVLDNAARYRLLRLLLAKLDADGELDVFGRIAQTPGFIRLMADFLYELKQSMTDPRKFGLAALTDKDREVARIYALYQDMLRQNAMVDREGEGWLALDELENNKRLYRDIALLLVDGYDQFNPLQSQLLTLLASRAGETLITLTQVPGREATIGKRFQRAFDRLVADHQSESVVHRVRRPLAQSSGRHSALRHLIDAIFTPNPVRPSANGGIRLLEAPDVMAEVGAALRHAKSLILAGGKPDDILIAVRDWARYGGCFDPLARAYGLPLSVDGGEALAENPAIYALLRLLELHRTDFRRRDLLDVLRSAYWAIPGIGAAEIDLLERVSRARLVTSGRKDWLVALQPAAPRKDEEGELDDADPQEAAQLAALHDALERFFAAITPPPARRPDDYAAWLEDLLGSDPSSDPDDEETSEPAARYSLNWIAQARAGTVGMERGRIVARDLAALGAFKRMLRGMLGAYRLFTTLEDDEPPGWDAFYGDLVNAVKGATLRAPSGRDGRILVTTVTEARGLPHRHLIVLGLSEGVFPMRAAQDPLYLDSERLALRGRDIELLTQAERSDDDGLFYEMISLATESLTLTRTTLEKGAPLPASHLWNATSKLFQNALPHELRIGAVVPLAEVASGREAALAIAHTLTQETPDGAAAMRWWVETYPATWSHIVRARQIELQRMSRARHNHYSGRLQDAALVAQAGEQFINRTWSASQLNDYGMCGFRFFAKRMLRLEALTEPEEGMDAAQLGSIYHEILEATYRQIAADGLTITPENTDAALEIFGDHAARLLIDAPARLGFRASPLWVQQQETILQRLRALIRDDFDPESALNKTVRKLSGDAIRKPWILEAPFGDGGGMRLDVDGETLRLRGKIDRIDRAGDKLLIFDYKSGSTTIPTQEITRGRNFQMMIYLLAAEALGAGSAAPPVAGGAFWHISNRKTSGELRPDDSAIEEGRAHLAAYLARGRAGDFSAEANKIEEGKCSRYCDYASMCRMAVMPRGKA